MTAPTMLPGPQPIATDSSNSRLHRQQIAAATNALIKKVFDNNTSTTQQIASLTQTVTNNNTTLTASLSSEAGIRASADSALGSSITSINAALSGYTGANAVANAVSSLNASISTTNGNVSALSSSLTTLSTAVGNNTASISTLSSSVSGIQAMWGLQLDINGNIIGRVELSGSGATSTFSVNASNFEVFDGSGSTPAFQITGGVAYLNVPLFTNAVATSTIQNNAVTSDPSNSYGSFSVGVPGGSTNFANISVTSAGGPIIVTVSGSGTFSNGGQANYSLIRNDTGAVIDTFSWTGGGTNPWQLMGTVIVAAGTYTFSVNLDVQDSFSLGGTYTNNSTDIAALNWKK